MDNATACEFHVSGLSSAHKEPVSKGSGNRQFKGAHEVTDVVSKNWKKVHSGFSGCCENNISGRQIFYHQISV